MVIQAETLVMKDPLHLRCQYSLGLENDNRMTMVIQEETLVMKDLLQIGCQYSLGLEVGNRMTMVIQEETLVMTDHLWTRDKDNLGQTSAKGHRAMDLVERTLAITDILKAERQHRLGLVRDHRVMDLKRESPKGIELRNLQTLLEIHC